MPFRKGPSKAVYSELALPRIQRKRRKKLIFLAILAAVAAFVLFISLYLRKLSSGIAASDARDAVTLAINDTVNRIMTENDYGYDYFVTLEKDADGNITAITTNTARINALSTEILRELVQAADSRQLDVRIRAGDLLGSNLLLGRGPEIPVEISMLTSSFVRFDNALVSTGINQSRHTLTLKADVDIDILIPWGSVSTTVETDILLAETVIVGRVPDTYVNVEDPNGYS